MRAYPYGEIHGGSVIDNIEYLVAVVIGPFLAGVERYRADNLVQLFVAEQHPSHFFFGSGWGGSYLEKVRPQNCTCFSRMAIWGLGDEIFIYKSNGGIVGVPHGGVGSVSAHPFPHSIAHPCAPLASTVF